MTLIISPNTDKITKTFVEDFMVNKTFKKKKLQPINAAKDQDKKTAMELYNELRHPITGYMDSIVINTWLALRDVIGQYWFKTHDGNHVSIAYDTFAIKKWNRNIDPKHVVAVINEYKKKWYMYNTWVVNEKWEVINGQHRLISLQIIKEIDNVINPFIFEIVPESGIDLIKSTNTISADWKWLDFLSSWVNYENNQYIELNKLYYETYDQSISISELVRMLDWGNADEARERFRDLQFTMASQRKKQVLEFIEISKSIFSLLDNKKSKIPWTWFRVLNRVSQLPWFDFKRLSSVLSKTDIPSVINLRKMSSFPEQIVYDEIINAYNYGLSKKKITHKHRKELIKEIPTYQFVS